MSCKSLEATILFAATCMIYRPQGMANKAGYQAVLRMRRKMTSPVIKAAENHMTAEG